MINPIGVFDSGLGGLTVVKQLKKILPAEHLVYFGDTARIPYGTRSQNLIKQYALEDARLLMQYDIKMLVVACNTASSSALPYLKERINIPVVGVVKPGAAAAAAMSRSKRIGVIGTAATINSQAYTRHIQKLIPQAQVFGQACPLLVPLVEEGWLDNRVTRLTLEKYLKTLLYQNIDALILGCTHYPLLRPLIQQVVGPQVTLIDSGEETAKVVKEILQNEHLLNVRPKQKRDRFIVSDSPDKFKRVGSRFLGYPLEKVEEVDFEAFLQATALNEN